MSAETITAFTAPSEPGHAANDPTPQARPFLKVAEAGLNTLKEFAANPEAFLSGEDGQGMSETALTAWADARVRLREFQSEAEIYVRANPTKAVLGAVGVGFVLGLLLKR
jgi:ElaB/YqjD/DUF883 family membrane-anchored ribosome-binding protein